MIHKIQDFLHYTERIAQVVMYVCLCVLVALEIRLDICSLCLRLRIQIQASTPVETEDGSWYF